MAMALSHYVSRVTIYISSSQTTGLFLPYGPSPISEQVSLPYNVVFMKCVPSMCVRDSMPKCICICWQFYLHSFMSWRLFAAKLQGRPCTCPHVSYRLCCEGGL